MRSPWNREFKLGYKSKLKRPLRLNLNTVLFHHYETARITLSAISLFKLLSNSLFPLNLIDISSIQLFVS